MAASHVSGPWYSENGYFVVPVGSSGYYIAEHSDGSLKIGAGGTVGTNVAISIDSSGNVTIPNVEADLVVESGLIKQENATGSIEVTGDDAADQGGNFKAYGASHATKASNWELRQGSTVVMGYDHSALELNIAGVRLDITAKDSDEPVLRLYSSADGGTVRQIFINADQATEFEFTCNFTPGSEAMTWSSTLDGVGHSAVVLDRANTRLLISSSYSLEIDGALDHDGTTAGFYGVTPVSRASAYTQTYSTADKTIAAPTAAALTVADGAGTNDGTIAAIGAGAVDTACALQADVIAAVQELADQINKLVADTADTKQAVNSIIDDLQAIGIVQ